MNKRRLMIACFVGLSAGLLSAVTSNLVTPLSFEQKPRTYVHYPFLFEADLCSNWSWEGFGVYYQRNACDAFGCNLDCATTNQCSDDCNKVTTHTVPLAQLWFGKSSFMVADAFENGEVSASTGNPFLNLTTFSPQLSYNERGAFLGATINRYNLGCCRDWFISARIGLPISTVEVNQRNVCDCGSINPDFANMIVSVQQQFNGQANDGPPSTQGSCDAREVKAYRLDLLSSLKLPNGDPMIVYGTSSSNTTVAGEDITINVNQVSQGSSGPDAPMYVYKQSSGVIPIAPPNLTRNTSYPTAQYQDLMIGESPRGTLAADGVQVLVGGVGPLANLADGEFASFNGIPNAIGSQVNYAGGLGASTAAQKQLFLVPVNASSSITFEPIGLTVQNTIDRIIEELQLSGVSAISFLAEKGIDIGRSSCRTGAGDLFLDIWGGKQKECWFADGLIGFRFPTSSKLKCPQDIYAQPNGSNGHFGLKLGAEGGYMVCDWIGLKLELFYTHFFKATETRAAVFAGSNIRNIGPCVDARVSWNTVLLYADATFFSRQCPDLGWDFGYELYAKSKDNLSYCVNELADFAGQVKPLDACNARRGSDVQSHKLRAEIFNRWGCFQIFFGGSYIVAGKNVMKETEWHLGMTIDF